MSDATTPPGLRDLKALLLGVVYLVLGVLGTPGLDFLKPRDLVTPAQQAELHAELGSPWAELGILAAQINRGVRLPLESRLAPIQRPFRISQSWALYRDGPNRVRRLEVWVDGTLRHRSADPAYDWLAPQLRNRRVRPMVESTAMAQDAQNWQGLTRYIARCAARDFPGAQQVELRAMAGNFPGRKLTEHHRFVARAPAWEPERGVVPGKEAP